MFVEEGVEFETFQCLRLWLLDFPQPYCAAPEPFAGDANHHRSEKITSITTMGA